MVATATAMQAYGPMARILLTGATGFVGRQIHRALLGAGHQVTPVVRPGSRHRLEAGSSTDPVVCDDMFRQDEAWWADVCTGMDALIHAAWYVEPGKYLDSPENITCAQGTLTMARGAADAGVRHIIGIGTCFEYRLPSASLDVMAPVDPVTLYAAAKLSVFHLLRPILAARGVAFSWCRLFYLFGEGENPVRLVPYLRGKLSAGEVASLSAGTQLRDFMDVADAGAMVAAVVDTGQTGAINICSGEAITIRALAERIADEYGRRNLLQFGTAAIHPSDPAAVVGICNAQSRGPGRDA